MHQKKLYVLIECVILDAEKQHAINLFLGLFIPQEHNQPIWEENTDYYLHHPEAIGQLKPKRLYDVFFLLIISI